MALIKCPECGKDISEYAIQCGYCFYPLKEKSVDTAVPTPKVSRIRNGKPSRNGNGTGSITHVKGNLRKPFRVTVTVGWKYDNEKGRVKQIRKNIGYFETRADAQIALANYIQNPYNIDASKITFAEIYEKWSTEHFPNISQSNIHGYNAAYKLCTDIQHMVFADIRLSHLQGIVDDCGKNYPTLRKLKVLFNVMYGYVMKNDVCSKDYSEFVDINKYKDRNPNKNEHTTFSKEEIKKLWNVVNHDEYMQIPLVLIYTGLRVGELWNLKTEDVDLADRYFEVTKSKTDAGVRTVPIAEKIAPFFEHWLSKHTEYVFTNRQGGQFKDRNFRDSYWQPTMDLLNFEHKPHDTRHTCISLLTANEVDDKIIRKIVGHAGKTVTETVYTHLEIDLLIEAINKI